MVSIKRYSLPEAVKAAKKEKSKRWCDKAKSKIIERSEVTIENPTKQLKKQPEKKLNKGDRPQKYKDKETYRSVNKVRGRKYRKEYQRKKREG